MALKEFTDLDKPNQMNLSLIIENIQGAFREIFEATIIEPSIWWLLAPLIILWITIEIYRGEHPQEKLGWNTLFANGISLCWVTIESIRFLFYEPTLTLFAERFVILLVILGYGVFVIIGSFLQRVPMKVMSFLAGPSLVYFLAIVTILWGHGLLDITPWVAVALFFLFVILAGAFAVLRMMLAQDFIGFIPSLPQPGVPKDDLGKGKIEDDGTTKSTINK